ncbi:MAG TPA: pitrilysin family protein [bacterium]|nr:pitrilysin family protein [bacterium]
MNQRFNRVLFAIVLLGFMLAPLHALDESKVQEFELDNGLKVITYEMHTAPMIYSKLTYNVGAKYEPYGQTGISHIVEHMMFKGTERFSKGKISKLISDNGGIFNAYTSNDVTVYYELLPKDKIDLAFDIESSRMHKCKFDPEEFKSEIGVIQEERKQRTENSHQGQRREEVNSIIYKSHPYRDPVIGWMHDISSITRDQAYSYYKKYYTPNNATLVLSGDFETEEILKKVKKYYGDIPAGPELPDVEFRRVNSKGKKTLEYKHPDITSESIKMYFNAPTRNHEDGPALYIAGKILGGRSATSRLYKRLVREEELCTMVGGGLSFSKDPRSIGFTAKLLKSASIEEVEKAIWEEIDSLKNYSVEDYDLQKIKNKIEFNEITGDQYISQIGGQIGTYENYFGDWGFINEWTEKIQAVSKQDIMDVTQKYFIPENLFVCYSYPDTTEGSAEEINLNVEKEQKEGKKTSIAKSKEKEKGGLFSGIANIFDKEGKPVEVLYKPKLEDASAPRDIEPLIDSTKLDNGIPLYVIENHDFPTTMIIGFVETGRVKENKEYPGIRSFVEKMLKRGTDERTYNEMLEERSFTPYQLQNGQSWSTITFSGYSLKKDTDKMLKGMYDIMVNPVFPKEQMEKIRPRLISSAEDFKKTDRMKAFYKLFETVFEGHQYSIDHAGDPEAFKELTRKDLVEFYNKYYSPEKMKMIAVGDFDKDWIANKLNQHIGQWEKESHDPGLEFGEIDPIEDKKVFVYHNPEYKQCRVDIAFQPVEGGIKKGNPDVPAIKILERVLCGSSLTSRMGVELRDNRGLCYNIKSNLWIRKNGGYWNIRTKTDKDNAKEMINGIFEQIEKVQEEGITKDELQKAKFRGISLLSYRVRAKDDLGSLVYNMLRYGQPLDYFDNSRERIMSVTLEDVKRVANKYLDTENYIISVSGDLEEDALDSFK